MAAAVDLAALAAAAGTTVPGLKLLLGVLVGYPLSCLYLLLPRSTPLEVKVRRRPPRFAAAAPLAHPTRRSRAGEPALGRANAAHSGRSAR